VAKPGTAPTPVAPVGETRSALDATLGPPTGESPDKLVVYRKDNVEYRVAYSEGAGQALAVVQQPPATAPLTLEAAMAEARKLFPRDAQPTSQQPEGNERFVVERFTSASLASSIPTEVWRQRDAEPGDFIAVYLRDQSGRITRVVVGIGNDPDALLALN
jgi:hypothetical protein